MTKGRRALAGICAFLFIVSGFVSLLLTNIERKTFSSETYKQAFRQQGLYAKVPALFVEMAAASAREPGNNVFSFASRLDRDDLELAITAMLPPEEFEALMDGFLDSTFAFVNGEADSVSVSLIPFKRSMTAEQGAQAILKIMLAQPDCTLEQLAQMGLGGDVIFCKPPEEAMNLVAPLIGTQLQFMAGGMPDELVILSTAQSASLFDERAQLNRIRTAVKLSLLLPLALLLAVTLLAVRGLSDWLKWWGIPFLITGILGTLTAMLIAPLAPSVVGNALLQNTPAIPAELLAMARDAAVAITREVFRPVAIQGIILTATGSVMIIVNAIVRRND